MGLDVLVLGLVAIEVQRWLKLGHLSLLSLREAWVMPSLVNAEQYST
jgi:hypothetical protein